MRKLLSFGICVILLLGCVFPAWAQDSPAAAAVAQRAADALVQTYGVSSVQYALIDGETIVISGSSGLADRAENRPVTARDMYGIGSTSKMFTAAAAMQLHEKGLIDIDTKLTAYIPEFTMADPRYALITPRMLLNHSSGIYGTGNANVSLFDDAGTRYKDALLSRLAAQNLSGAPGQKAEYCNDAFTLLEVMIERVSGMSFTQYIAERFCQPLGLKNTKTPLDDFDKDRLLVRAYLGGGASALPNDTLGAIGSGGIYSTAEDLCRFARVLMGKVPGILKRQTALAMQSEEYKKGVWPIGEGDNLMAFGLGWDSVHSYPFSDYSIQVLSKGGDTNVFHSSLAVIPAHGIAAAVVSSAGGSALDYAAAASILEAYLLEKCVIGQISPTEAAVLPVKAEIPAALREYAGHYSSAVSAADISLGEDTLTITPVDGGTQTVYIHSGNGIFMSGGGNLTAQFTRQKDGNVYLQSSQVFVIPEVGRLKLTKFDLQKLAPARVSPEVMEAWNARRGLRYFVVNEKASSQNYLLDPAFLSIKLNDSFDRGYAFAGIRITGENAALNTVIFRDVFDLAFVVKDKAEYLLANDLVLIRQDFIPELTAETGACLIGQDGYARYFTLNSDTAGKTMTVSLPEDAAYAVYDTNYECVNFSAVSREYATKLPASGMLVFIGKPGDAFGIEIK